MLKRVAVSTGIIQAFVALGAIPAGLSMIFEPDGSGVGMSTEILAKSPFPDFFIPGLFLFFVNGLFNLIAAYISFKRKRYAGIPGIILGSFLVIWICTQVYYIGLAHFVQPLFFMAGVIEIILSYIFIAKSGSTAIE
ncbi:MAG: hypothetical protein GXO86_14495 [Chlorobi bacterium]|nr:hypothetical protein [Chlorobiota bacterium]